MKECVRIKQMCNSQSQWVYMVGVCLVLYWYMPPCLHSTSLGGWGMAGTQQVPGKAITDVDQVTYRAINSMDSSTNLDILGRNGPFYWYLVQTNQYWQDPGQRIGTLFPRTIPCSITMEVTCPGHIMPHHNVTAYVTPTKPHLSHVTYPNEQIGVT